MAEQVVCSLCGKDLTVAAELLGKKEVQAMHRHAHRVEDYNTAAKGMQEMIDSLPISRQQAGKLRLQFEAVIGQANGVIQSHEELARLGQRQLHPSGI